MIVDEEVEEFVAVDVEVGARLEVEEDVVRIVLVIEMLPVVVVAAVDVEEPPTELVDEARDPAEVVVLLAVELVRPPMPGKTAKATMTMMTMKPMMPAANTRLTAARRVPVRVRE